MNQQALTPSERARVGLWIRLARCYNLAFRELRSGLREECTMPQFDVLAQLERSPEGLTFSAISEKLLVTAGNLTGIAVGQIVGMMNKRRPARELVQSIVTECAETLSAQAELLARSTQD